jgi:hypothetical protein
MQPSPSNIQTQEDIEALDSSKPTFYANAFHGALSLYDVRIAFGKGNPFQSGTYDMSVYMSMPAAKQLSRILVDLVAAYEEDFGEIPLEPMLSGKQL